jgi:ribosome modulation factor
MGRKKKVNANSNGDSPSSGHNKPELTEDEQRALLYHHKGKFEEAAANLSAAKAARKAVCDLAKAECGKGAVADIKELILLEAPKAGAALRADMERRLRLARWANVPVGTQFTFSELDVPPTAYELGKTAGLKGQAKRPPHDPNTQQYESWMSGWNDGQAVHLDTIREKIRPMDPPLGMPFPEEGSDLPPTKEFDPPDTADAPFAPPAT